MREVKESMTTEELYGWSAFYSLKAEIEHKAFEDAQRKAQVGKIR